MTGSTMSWYVSRGTGVVTPLLFTAVLVLGLMATRKGRLPGLPGFAVTSLAATIWRFAAAARQPPRAARVPAVFTQHAEHSRGGSVREPTSR